MLLDICYTYNKHLRFTNSCLLGSRYNLTAVGKLVYVRGEVVAECYTLKSEMAGISTLNVERHSA